MQGFGARKRPAYERLRAAYNAAFRDWREQVNFQQCVLREPRPDTAAVQRAQRGVEQALSAYRECRDRLADYLLAGTRPANGAELKRLAYRLWEESGRPAGNPEEHWYRAEAMLRGANPGAGCAG
jgi:hypothetical protein